MVIAHNLQAMNAQRQYGIEANKQAKSTEKLSSGYKINRAADDAAGLSISEKMRKQIRGLTMASANAEDGISMVQIADGAMAEVHEMIDRGVELSVKAANGTLSYADRRTIQDEIDQIKLEIDGIKERTKFNEIYVLKGEKVDTTTEVPAGVDNAGNSLPAWVTFGSAMQDGYMSETFTTKQHFIVDPNAQPTVEKEVSIDHSAASIDFSNWGGTADLIGKGFHTTCCTCSSYYSIEFVSGTPSAMEQSGTNYIYKINVDNVQSGADLVNAIIDGTNQGWPNGHFTKLAVDPNQADRLYIYDDRSIKSETDVMQNAPDWDPATSIWKDWDQQYYSVSANPAFGLFGQGTMHGKTAFLVTGYVENPQQLALQVGTDADSGNRMSIKLAVISSKALGIDTVDVTTIEGADAAITAFSDAKAIVSTHRSRMGAYQNRLEHTVKNLDNVVENTTAAESQIRDTDMAKEMVTYSNTSILIQAGQSMIAQANQSNQGVLSLIA